MSGPASVNEERGKSWLQGSHTCTNSSKLLAGDPDVKFESFNIQPAIEEDFDSDFSDEQFSDASSDHKDVNDNNLVAIEDTESVIYCDEFPFDALTPKGDLPLLPRVREDIVRFLNNRLREDFNQLEDE